LFSKNNGNLGETGCVAWMFKRVGLIAVKRENIKADEDDFILQVLEYGAEDVKAEEEVYEIITAPELLMQIKEALETDKIETEMADLIMMPDTTIDINDEAAAAKVLKLIEMLEDHDDVQNVYSNANMLMKYWIN
jgi:transcriptional/translational regulatory protein YebC/TACO1